MYRKTNNSIEWKEQEGQQQDEKAKGRPTSIKLGTLKTSLTITCRQSHSTSWLLAAPCCCFCFHSSGFPPFFIFMPFLGENIPSVWGPPFSSFHHRTALNLHRITVYTHIHVWISSFLSFLTFKIRIRSCLIPPEMSCFAALWDYHKNSSFIITLSPLYAVPLFLQNWRPVLILTCRRKKVAMLLNVSFRFFYFYPITNNISAYSRYTGHR